MDILSNEIVRARKTHICELCVEKINIGEKHRCMVLVDDGIWAYRAHLDCENLIDTLNMDEYNEGINADGFRECIIEEYSNMSSLKKSDISLIPLPALIEAIKKKYNI
jgi:hypothetical protein